MTFVAILITCVLIGWLAQAKKQRTGALWGFLTMLVLVAVWLFLYLCVLAAQPNFFDRDAKWYSLALLVCVGVGLPMALIVLTLPKKSREGKTD